MGASGQDWGAVSVSRGLRSVLQDEEFRGWMLGTAAWRAERHVHHAYFTTTERIKVNASFCDSSRNTRSPYFRTALLPWL